MLKLIICTILWIAKSKLGLENFDFISDSDLKWW